MKNKVIVFLMLIVMVLGTGCTKKEEKVDTIELVWQMEWDVEKYEPYFNEVLEKKGYPYRVDFVTESSKRSNQTVDLLNIETVSWQETYNMTAPIKEGKVIALDEYFATEHGGKLKATLPEKLWEVYKVDGKQYSILSAGYPSHRTVYIWDETLAKEYGIHPEEWSEKIWEYKDELLKVQSRGVTAVNGITTLYLKDAVGMTKVLGMYYPIVMNENDSELKAEFLYETEEYQEALKGIQSLHECGIYQPEAEIIGESEAFLKIDTVFFSENAYQQWQEEGFWESHGVKIIDEDTLWKLGCTVTETGITTESQQPEEAFRFMCALYEDKDLTNALMWGEEGEDYDVIENVAVKKGSAGEAIPCNNLGNQWIGYIEKGQDPERAVTYIQIMENAKESQLSGFDFSGEGCEKELEAVFQVSIELNSVTGKIFVTQPELIVQKYKDAGIDKVVEEWNREFQEWKEQQ